MRVRHVRISVTVEMVLPEHQDPYDMAMSLREGVHAAVSAWPKREGIATGVDADVAWLGALEEAKD
jgi:hypothetical protein